MVFALAQCIEAAIKVMTGKKVQIMMKWNKEEFGNFTDLVIRVVNVAFVTIKTDSARNAFNSRRGGFLQRTEIFLGLKRTELLVSVFPVKDIEGLRWPCLDRIVLVSKCFEPADTAPRRLL